MYRAKRSGPGRYHVFDHAEDQAVTARYQLAAELRAALCEQALRVHYQPIVEIDTGTVYAVEALLRWQHPDGRLRPAAEFIYVAEHSGLLPEIGRWVITQACGQLAAWDALLADRAPQRMFLNLSVGELSRPELLTDLADAAAAAGVAPRRLVLEVTESGMLDVSRTADTLDALQRLGCQFALDDFGTGYSSLSRLVHLPAEVLKIDRSFLQDLSCNRQSVAVVAAVLTLAHNLRKTVVAEGVEDAATLASLQDLGCT